MTRSWPLLLATVHPAAEFVGKFTAYQLASSEYVTTFDGDLEGCRAWLREQGYERHELRAAKFHPRPSKAVDWGSYRRVPEEHPRDVLAVGGGRDALDVADWDPRFAQYHVHIWPNSEGVGVYSHYEIRGDVHPIGWESPADVYRRCKTHYYPIEGQEYVPGVTDLTD